MVACCLQCRVSVFVKDFILMGDYREEKGGEKGPRGGGGVCVCVLHV